MVQTAKALIEAIQPLPFYRVLNVNAISLNNAGAYISQELGYALAWGNEYMNQLTDAGIPAATVAKKIKFNFGISSNYFLEIAKFRAARMLWANIVASYHPECLRDCDNKGLMENVVVLRRWRFMPKLPLSILLCLMLM